METRHIGSLEVSLAGLGTNNFGPRIDRDQAIDVIHAALDEGVTMFDTGDAYGGGCAEEWLADGIGPRRDEVVLATKFGWLNDVDRESVLTAVDGSLKRLRTDRIDVLYCHRPHPETSLTETMQAMADLVAAGKVREIGYSNVTAADVHDAAAIADDHGHPRFSCVEDQYNLLFRKPERELIPACVELGMTFVPFFPLASGLLTGKYRLGEPPDPDSRLGWGLRRIARETGADVETLTSDAANALRTSMNWHPHEHFDVDMDAVAALMAFSDQCGRTMTELALGWLAAQPAVPTIIAGATSPEQVHTNARATGCRLTADEVAELDRITAPPAPGEPPAGPARLR
jgi:aryl-alcohol dehydrogenase-like predicted oxidoreductase